MDYKFAIGDKVIFTNCFGVCWGVKTISGLDERSGKPTYFYEESDSPWFSSDEQHFTLAAAEDFELSRDQLQTKYGFTPTEYFGCY